MESLLAKKREKTFLYILTKELGLDNSKNAK